MRRATMTTPSHPREIVGGITPSALHPSTFADPLEVTTKEEQGKGQQEEEKPVKEAVPAQTTPRMPSSTRSRARPAIKTLG